MIPLISPCYRVGRQIRSHAPQCRQCCQCCQSSVFLLGVKEREGELQAQNASFLMENLILSVWLYTCSSYCVCIVSNFLLLSEIGYSVRDCNSARLGRRLTTTNVPHDAWQTFPQVVTWRSANSWRRTCHVVMSSPSLSAAHRTEVCREQHHNSQLLELLKKNYSVFLIVSLNWKESLMFIYEGSLTCWMGQCQGR